MPPSHRDLDTSVNFVKNLLQNEPSRARSPSGLDTPVSRLPNRSLHSSSAPGAGGRQDATVYKHTDEEPAGGYYTPRSRHLDRSAVRASSERDSPAADLTDMKRQLENTARMLDRATEESALRTAEDDALDREMSDLKWKVKRVQEDLEYASRGPRSFRADEERRRLERELLELMHERVPAVEKKLAEREERRARQKREWDRERDRRNETFGRFDDRDRDRDRYGSSYSHSDSRARYDSSYERDRVREGDYRDDRSHVFDRDRSYRDRSHSRERNYDREHPRSPPAATRSPPPPPPAAAPVGIAKPPPAPPLPGKSPAPNVKNMTSEERRAFLQAEAQRRTAERMAALGLSPSSFSTPKPTLDTSTEDRLAREKKEAEERARAAEEAAAERARQRDERLRNERGGGTSTPAGPAAVASPPPAAATPKVPPPVKPRAPAPPPPRKPGVSVAARSTAAPAPPKPTPPVPAPTVPRAAPPSAPRAIDSEEEELHAREQALRKQKEERLARIRRLEEEEREEEAQRQREEAARLQREQEETARKAKQERLERLKLMEEEEAAEAKREEDAREARRARTPAPASIAPPPAPVAPTVPPLPSAPPTGVTSPADRGKNNPFNRLISGGASPAVPTSSPTNGGNNPFFRSQPDVPPPIAPNSATSATSPASAPPAPAPPAAVPPPASKSPAPPVVKTSYHTAPGDSEDEWGQEKDDDDDSSEDELNSSRDTRDRLARQLFSSILPPSSGPPRPPSAPAGANTTSKASTPTAMSAPTPPPPPPSAPPAPAAPVLAVPAAPPAPPIPLAPPPPAVAAPVPTGDRSALLGAIQSGARLRKTVTNDRSASAVSGRVLGDAGPPPHVSAAPTLPPTGTSHSEDSTNSSRQSIDWYMGLAADQGTHVSQEPSLPPMGEEDEDPVHKEVNGHATPVPEIEVAHVGVESDLLDDIDRSTGAPKSSSL